MKESTSKKFLIDGFPRAMEQVFGYQEWFGRQGQAVLFLTCTEAVMTERIMARAQGRDDDNPETIQKRLEKFSDVSMPVIEWYRSHTDMLKTIDATRSLEEVAKDVDAYISGLEGAFLPPLLSVVGSVRDFLLPTFCVYGSDHRGKQYIRRIWCHVCQTLTDPSLCQRTCCSGTDEPHGCACNDLATCCAA